MKVKTVLDGNDLKTMFAAGAGWLERIAYYINGLNVFPVPDGDCGTNMLLTMRASLEQVDKLEDGNVSSVAEAIARGALMGARGNSGVILSQIWRGFQQELKDKKVINAGDLANAFEKASDVAYRALTNPEEGTILTVIRDAAAAARREASNPNTSLTSVMEAAVSAARLSVINTPNLLAVLKEAGVVDSGGHGLYTFLEGALFHLKGETDGHSPEQLSGDVQLTLKPVDAPTEEDSYGFCTQFMVRSEKMEVARLRSALEPMGVSLIVVGDTSVIRVHIHTKEPEAVTKLASSFGTLSDIDIRNMDEQHQEYLLKNRGDTTPLSTAVIAVVSGEGLVKVFFDLGAAAIVPMQEIMNSSTMDILRTVDELPSDNIILLPNSEKVIPTALKVQSLTQKNISVIPTKTIPQGISALLAFMTEAKFETNVSEMTEAIASVITIEISRAARAVKSNKSTPKKGQIIGVLDGQPEEAGDSPEDVIFQLLSRLNLTQAGIVTVYYGKDITGAEANRISDKIRKRYPDLEVGLVSGGQSDNLYIISVE
jgi:DAK2 domain fusion protein YloV